ncbi:hypothetical protein NHX12_005144 [Muraenolepis orangiensis]|uniref:Peptidase M12B propeptide domain-containing protein n=1 Tax=Muraenolepis orangiensis TaxID=630683 RepID=A0A9Q0DTF4_9TELE|nr:hypothetical protein NHX12_005144 [Muraenolepis orangiensis]
MDCLFLLIWTLPFPLGGGSSVRLLSTLLSWNVLKTLQISCSHSMHTVSATHLTDHLGFNQDYMFVTPVEVDAHGGYVTHDVLRGAHRRRGRRSAPAANVHYRLSAFGRDMHLDLRPSAVVGPGFAVQTLGSDGVVRPTAPTREEEGGGFGGCLYQGFVRNLSSQSSAAISTCAGLALGTNPNPHPIPQSPTSPNPPHPPPTDPSS